MAEVAALELQIGSNVDKALSGLSQFGKSLFQLKEDLKTFKAAQETTFDPKQFAAYQKRIDQITTQIKNRFASMEVAAESTGKSMQTLTKTSSSATNSLFALSGVVQDAPYGFRAIANNITFLSQQMAYTSKEAGGFGAALKAMGSAMIGPAGIIFAISAATSLLDFFLNKTKKTGDAANEAAIKIQTFNDALKTGAQNAQKDVVNLDLLYKAATNVNKSMTERLAAVKELQAKYPSYLGNESKEAILTGQAADAYARLKNQIIATARAKAAEADIVKNEQQRLTLEAKLQDLGAKRNKLEAQIAEKTKEEGINLKTNARGYNAAALGIAALQTKLDGLNNTINETVNKYNKLTDANRKLALYVNAADLTTHFGGGTTTSGSAATQNGDIRQAAFNVNQSLENVRNNYRAFTQAASQNIADIVTMQFNKIGTAVKTAGDLMSVAEIRFQQFQTRLQKGLVDSAQVIRESIVDTLSTVTEGFANNGFAGAADALLSTLGEIAVRLGKIAIGVGIGIQGIQLALESLNPLAAIAAGIALVAIGSVAKSSVKNMAFADGGVVYGPTNALIGEYPGARSNPEVVAPLDKLRSILANAGANNSAKIPAQIVLRAYGPDLQATINTQNRISNKRG